MAKKKIEKEITPAKKTNKMEVVEQVVEPKIEETVEPKVEEEPATEAQVKMEEAIEEQLAPKSDIEAGRGDFKEINEAIDEVVMEEKQQENNPLYRCLFGYTWNGQILEW